VSLLAFILPILLHANCDQRGGEEVGMNFLDMAHSPSEMEGAIALEIADK
jgi:hypothetical protein